MDTNLHHLHGTRNVDCFNSLLWFCFVWTAVEKTLRLRLISTCTGTKLSIASFRFSNKDRSQLLHLQENTVVLASVNEQKMTGRLTDAEKYLTFRLLRSLTFRFIYSLVARNTTSVLARKNTNADFISLQAPNYQIISKSVGVVFLCAQSTPPNARFVPSEQRFDFTKSIHFRLRFCFSDSLLP